MFGKYRQETFFDSQDDCWFYLKCIRHIFGERNVSYMTGAVSEYYYEKQNNKGQSKGSRISSPAKRAKKNKPKIRKRVQRSKK